MASKKQIEANALNARHSRGPRSTDGKRRSSRNAVRFGLATPETSATHLRKLEKLARRIAGVRASPIVFEFARTAAGAELEISRVQRLKVALIERVKATGTLVPPKFFRSLMQEIRWTQQMFRWSIGSRRTRPSLPIAVNALPPMPVEEPARTAEACRRVLTELLRLARYENRAISRWHAAIRQMIQAKLAELSSQGRRPI
jgi:hypothetical protein